MIDHLYSIELKIEYGEEYLYVFYDGVEYLATNLNNPNLEMFFKNCRTLTKNLIDEINRYFKLKVFA